MAAVGEAGRPAGGVLEFYLVVWRATRDYAVRYRLGLIAEAVFIAAYVVLRTAGLGRDAMLAWLIATILLSLVAPASGLVVLAAIAPFSEPLVFTRQLGAKPVIIVALAIGVGLRLAPEILRDAAARRLRRPPLPLILSAAVAVGTALGVVHSSIRFGPGFGTDAGQSWLAGIGGALVVLGIAYWAARDGNLRPLIAAVAAGGIGGFVSLADWLDAGLLRDSPAGWLLRPNRFVSRLTGIISSPNGVASLVVMPTAVLAAAAVLGRDVRLRAGAAAVLVPLLATLYYTYSRAALIGIFAIAVIVSWRIRRALGATLLIAGVVAGVVLLPTYLATRFQAVGSEGTIDPSGVLVASDRLRLGAWAAAGRMVVDSPIVGHGFLSYSQLHGSYGDPTLRAPHNEWLRLFAEEGVLIGLAGLGFLLSTLLALVRSPGWVGAGAAAAFAAWAVTATFNNPTGFIQVGIILGTVVGAGLGLSMVSRAARGDSAGKDLQPDVQGSRHPLGRARAPGGDPAAEDHVDP